jgi:hypothetical protein
VCCVAGALDTVGRGGLELLWPWLAVQAPSKAAIISIHTQRRTITPRN